MDLTCGICGMYVSCILEVFDGEPGITGDYRWGGLCTLDWFVVQKMRCDRRFDHTVCVLSAAVAVCRRCYISVGSAPSGLHVNQ